MPKFTSEQQAAIAASGKTIVSASAGSGKTTVMIQKIVGLIEQGTDVSKILAVTYTKKAAAQMKDKLKRELIKAINAPETSKADKKRLKEQLPKVASADISTVHSFCSRLIKSHFFAAEVNADFSILSGEGAEGSELVDKAMDAVFDEAYENREEDFLHLLSVYFRSKKDAALKRILKNLYSAVRVHADYKELLSAEAVGATEEKFDRISEELFGFLREKCDYYAAKIEEEKAYFSENDFAPSVANADELLNALLLLKGKQDYFEACAEPCPKFAAKQRAKKDFPDDFARHAEILNGYKKKVQKIFEENAEVKPREEELSNYLAAGKTAQSLAKYTLLFDEAYAEAKKLKNALDYNDLEHIALRLLSDEAVQNEMREKYEYVFVDEYQDVNPVQEKILSLLSGKNVFLVGDIKQAIYGFRGSKSAYFAQKQTLFEREEGANSLKLTKNFRSATPVLDAVNAAFSKAMTKAVSEVEYKEDSVMEGGGRYAANVGKVRLHYFPEEKLSAEKRERGVYSVESNYLSERRERSILGERIKEIVEKERRSKWYDADDGREKDVEYSDIAILTRKKRGVAEKIVAALTEAGIPVTASAEINVCDYPEIKTLTDILSLIDNGEQDIPLCSALLSPLGDLTTSELAEIRLAYPQENFYRNCCKKYVAERRDGIAAKLHAFYNRLQDLKEYAYVASAGEVLTKLLSETYMESRLLSKDNGAGCLKRIHHFLSQTTQSESLTVHGFLDFLKAVDYKIPYGESGGENTVKVMTMHASKGLEFPVVIVGDLSKSFGGDEDKYVLFDEEFGLATKCYKRESMTYTNTLLWKLCKLKNQGEEIKNELNLLYVALTRAKYSLHAVFSAPLGASNVRYATSYADFIDGEAWQRYWENEERFELPKEERFALVSGDYDALSEEIFQALRWKYPFTGGENLGVKTSATAQMQDKANEKVYYETPVLFEEEDEFESEDNPEERSKENGAEREEDRLKGLAYHAFLEYFDFATYPNGEKSEKENRIRAALSDMQKRGNLTGEEISRLDEKQLYAILENGIFREISNMRLYREQEFLAALPLKTVYREKAAGACVDDTVIFQGAIDLLATGKDEAWIVDYKYSKGGKEYIKEYYALQLELYKKAVAAILHIAEENIRCTVVNIRKGFQVDL